jgi:hypothetical protein
VRATKMGLRTLPRLSKNGHVIKGWLRLILAWIRERLVARAHESASRSGRGPRLRAK